MDKLSVSLDDVIKQDSVKKNRVQRGGRGGRGGGPGGGGRGGRIKSLAGGGTPKKPSLDGPLETSGPRPSLRGRGAPRARGAPRGRGGGLNRGTFVRGGGGGRPVNDFNWRRGGAAAARDDRRVNRNSVGIQKIKAQPAPRLNLSVNRAQQRGRAKLQAAPREQQGVRQSYRQTRNNFQSVTVTSPVTARARERKPAQPIQNDGLNTHFTSKDHHLMKNIKVVAQLDKVPAPLLAQKNAKMGSGSGSQRNELMPRGGAAMTLNERFGGRV
eukprot:Selendium_serpulae@DN4714_c0_g1_i3.p1